MATWRSKNGFRIALHYILCACLSGFGDNVELLLEAGADKEAKDKDGKSALDLATKSGAADVRKLLKRKRTD